jgi:hypothetical protein
LVLARALAVAPEAMVSSHETGGKPVLFSPTHNSGRVDDEGTRQQAFLPPARAARHGLEVMGLDPGKPIPLPQVRHEVVD